MGGLFSRIAPVSEIVFRNGRGESVVSFRSLAKVREGVISEIGPFSEIVVKSELRGSTFSSSSGSGNFETARKQLVSGIFVRKMGFSRALIFLGS